MYNLKKTAIPLTNSCFGDARMQRNTLDSSDLYSAICLRTSRRALFPNACVGRGDPCTVPSSLRSGPCRHLAA